MRAFNIPWSAEGSALSGNSYYLWPWAGAGYISMIATEQWFQLPFDCILSRFFLCALDNGALNEYPNMAGVACSYRHMAKPVTVTYKIRKNGIDAYSFSISKIHDGEQWPWMYSDCTGIPADQLYHQNDDEFGGSPIAVNLGFQAGDKCSIRADYTPRSGIDPITTDPYPADDNHFSSHPSELTVMTNWLVNA